jgi:hypothetical protein
MIGWGKGRRERIFLIGKNKERKTQTKRKPTQSL